jgi:DNA polymerase IV
MAGEPVHFHVDLDAFYASVEQVDRPELRGKAVIVGALPGHRGVVSACSYEARRFGVRSAMPISQAYRLCPQATFVPVRMARYIEVSQEVMAILRDFAPLFQQISVDEAALDLSGTERLLGEPEEVAGVMKARVRTATGLTISVGIGPNRYIAKLASERRKPDGLCRVRSCDAESFMASLPLDKLWGVGEKTLERLGQAGILSMADLRGLTEAELEARLGRGCGAYLYTACHGGDPGIHPIEPRTRSVSSETTFERDTADAEVLRLLVLELAEGLAERLIRERLSSETVVLKLRLEDFSTTTTRRSLGRSIGSSEEIADAAERLLRRAWDGRTPVRLVGVALADVKQADGWVQGDLLEDRASRARKVEEAVAAIRRRHEGLPITRASLLGRTRRGPPDGGSRPT